MTQRQKIAFIIRRPDEFTAGAEATLGDNLVRWRANERVAEERRNNEPGMLQSDGTVLAGVDPETGRKIFAAPRDESIQLDFNEAAEHVQTRNAKNYLGHDDWEVPSQVVLNVLYDSRHKGALAGTFQEDLSAHGVRAAFYWSAAPYYRDYGGYGKWFDNGVEDTDYTYNKKSVRLVRLSRETAL